MRRIMGTIGTLLAGIMILGSSMNVFAKEYTFEEGRLTEKLPAGVTKVTTINQDNVTVTLYQYDQNGNIIASYCQMEYLQENFYYEYDQNGRKIAETVETIGPDWQDIYTDTFEYIDNVVIWHSGSARITYTYDANGNLVHHDEPLCFYEDFLYDDNGNMTTKYFNGELQFKYAYDSQNRVCVIEDYEDDQIMDIIEIVYNDNGKVSQEISKNPRDLSIRSIINYTYEYDEFGRIVKELKSTRYEESVTLYEY